MINDHQAVNMLPDFSSEKDRESGKKTGTDDTVLETGNDDIRRGAQTGAQSQALCDNSCQQEKNIGKNAANNPAFQTTESGFYDSTCQQMTNAQERIRTSTSLSSLAPQASASASSATWAFQ